VFSQAALNASLNGTSAILLACGYAAIRRGKMKVHKAFMIAAFSVSTAFLISYLVYHYRVGHVAFQGQGWIRPVYFALLLSHTVLAVVIVPMILVTLRRAWVERFDKHKIIACWTLPLWFYVSVTGVIVYVLLYQVYPSRGGAGQPVAASSLLQNGSKDPKLQRAR
jgi:putative membrane protein